MEDITSELIEKLFYLNGKLVPSRLSPLAIKKHKLQSIIDQIMQMYPVAEKFADKIKIITNRLTVGHCKICNKELLPPKVYCCKKCMGADKTLEQKRMIKFKETMVQRYGVTSPYHLDSVKEKSKKTMVERYGVEHQSQRPEWKSICQENVNNKTDEQKLEEWNKRKATNLERYGYITNLHIPEVSEKARNALQTEEVMTRRKETNIERYGHASPMKNPAVVKKAMDKKIEKYGYTVFSYNITKEYLQEHYVERGKTFQEIADELGVAYATIQRYMYLHEIEIRYDHWQSSHERKVADEFPDEEIVCNKRFPGKFEIDILFKEYNLGVECDGLLWHSSFHKAHDKNYHKKKQERAAKQNIRLLQFFSNEITNSFEKVKSIINTNLGKASRIQGRKTKVKEIPSREYVDFCENNHIQNHAKAKIKIGLYDEDTLVGVMSFTKSRYDKNYEWELVRLCFKLNTVVIGGAEKMFNYFVKNYDPSSIISYCEVRLFTGKVYQNLGFNLIRKTEPGYHYTDGNKLFARQLFQKHKIKNEDEKPENLGLYKIYNSGNTVWGWGSCK